MAVSALLLWNGYPQSVMTGPTTPGVQTVPFPFGFPLAPPAPLLLFGRLQLFVAESQHVPFVQLSPALHAPDVSHAQPWVPLTQKPLPAPAWQVPDTQLPLWQSAPVVHVPPTVSPPPWHTPPVQRPLWQSAPVAQCAPEGILPPLHVPPTH